MALWGNTDNLAGKPKYVARKATFAAAKINTTTEAIDISDTGTGFNTGDEVVYVGDATGPTSGNAYFVYVAAAGSVILYDTYANAVAGGVTGKVNFTAIGTGTHSLQATGKTGDITAGGNQIVFVDATEAAVAANKAKGFNGAGWYRYQTYTDAQSTTRHKAELLIAMTVAAGTSGDASDDSIVADS